MEFRKFIRPNYDSINNSHLGDKENFSQTGFISGSVSESSYVSDVWKSPAKPGLIKKTDNKKSEGDGFNFNANEGYPSLKEGESVKVGNATVTITDGYGIRHWKGRENRHSTGIDIKTSTGKLHALQDFVIEDVKLQGDGSSWNPKKHPNRPGEGGYYIITRNSDGSKTKYMHLDPMSAEEMKALKGRKFKRGDEVWGYTTGSGSMTGPHIKVRHYGDNSKYNIDPSQLIRGESYSFIPDSKGENILKNT